MALTSRRSFLLLGAAAGAYGLLSKIPLARAGTERPHFLVSIQIQQGVDNTYLFDGRGPKVTEKNLQQNYLLKNDATPNGTMPGEFTPEKIAERTITCEPTGCTALRTPLVDALWAAHKDRLSIVNGIVMLPDNVSHFDNSAYLWGATARGGQPIYPPMIGKRIGGTPLDSIVLRNNWFVTPGPSNLAGSAELAPGEIAALSQTLGDGPKIEEDSPLFRHILARADANAASDGQFSAGAKNLAHGLRRAKATSDAFVAASSAGGGVVTPTLVGNVRQALAFFSAGMTRVATIVQDEPGVDLHFGAQSQQTLVTTYTRLAQELAAVIELLKTTMFVDANGQSIPFIDLTTFVVSSEFGRTSRNDSFPAGSSVGASGADHNPYSNFALVGGKGIVPGLVVGESDLRDCDDAGSYLDVSGAHRKKNPALNQIMGKPFDFASQKLRRDLPETFDDADYINMPSVMNTILDCFEVPEANHFKVRSRIAPILKVLRERSA